MSRRMNVCVWGVLVALAVSSLCDSAEAGGRRRRARYCQQTCCQPQPVCCSPAPRGPEYFCAWYLAYRFGSVGYYYAPHCQPSEHPSMSPVMIAANYDPNFVYGSHCNDTAGPYCVSDGFHSSPAPGPSAADMRDKQKTVPHKCAKLKTKLPSDHAGPEDPNDLFEVNRVGAKPGESDSGFYFVEFQAEKRNYIAKCAQYIVYFDGSRNNQTPESLMLVAHGHEVKEKAGRQLPKFKVREVVAVDGMSNAYNVTITFAEEITLPEQKKRPDITFLVFVAGP